MHDYNAVKGIYSSTSVGLSSHFPAEGGDIKKKGTKKKGSSFQTVSVLFRVGVFSGAAWASYRKCREGNPVRPVSTSSPFPLSLLPYDTVESYLWALVKVHLNSALLLRSNRMMVEKGRHVL